MLTMAKAQRVPAHRHYFYVSLNFEPWAMSTISHRHPVGVSLGFYSMQNAKLLLIDADAYTADVLMEDLEDRGYASVTRIENSLVFPANMAADEFDLVIFNYHFHDTSALLNCNAIKSILPKTALVVIASTGPAIKHVRDWAEKTGVIDVVVEKPLSDERFFLMIADLIKTHHTAATLQKRADRLANIVPEAALNAVDSDSKVLNEAEMNEAAVLFTDIRSSSEAIINLAPRDFFTALNNTLSIQSKIILGSNQFTGLRHAA